MTTAITLSDADFDDRVRRSDRPVLVDFWATWCPPCRFMEPVLQSLAEEYADRVTIAKLDVDANPRTAEAFGVQSIPTLILFQRGEPVQRLVGAQPRDLLAGILDGTLASHQQPRTLMG